MVANSYPSPWKLVQTADPEAKHALSPYVLSTWRRNARSCGLKHDKNRASRLLLSDTSTLWYVEDHEYPDVCVGWLLATPLKTRPILHYVYVRDGMRNRGVGQLLMLACGISEGETLYTTVVGRLPTPMRTWYQNVVSIEAKEIV